MGWQGRSWWVVIATLYWRFKKFSLMGCLWILYRTTNVFLVSWPYIAMPVPHLAVRAKRDSALPPCQLQQPLQQCVCVFIYRYLYFFTGCSPITTKFSFQKVIQISKKMPKFCLWHTAASNTGMPRSRSGWSRREENKFQKQRKDGLRTKPLWK